VKKTPNMVKLCQTRPDYFAAWEEGRGPGQNIPKQEPPAPMGLGDMVEAGLKAVGITEERYKGAKAAVGLKGDCNCGKRKAKLNEIGKKIGIG
jgi:hypothetical protein